ncbi:MAG: hypothetical protein HZC40_19555, partial [Chloroflexi bacterium]|nr:hypothetical protein [Chloroflexota bacterium]
KFQISNFKSPISNLFWLICTTLIAIVILERVAWLGLLIAIVGGVWFGVLVTRAEKSE